ncbi:uncharacterized protein BYT42DRAFT_559486 [Radiomyces spectabilis]|uniref:uncharacterized protein n=1 Tax=Radiomyces spectabilis TaxID=64574 RepID=UPI00221FEEDB|nr:uncharacterized protein BYT42DRAFT_559486 [Radiomyces spectabilis]KAI8388258.1 hypothetical protein BYT42DRAFT_559486 [Radiomyces spectabilis]
MYEGWSQRVEHACTLYWYRVRDVLSYLHELRLYILDSPGKLSSTYIPRLVPIPCPATRTTRFPDQGAYICEGFGHWNENIDHLTLFVSVMVYPHKLERVYGDLRSQGDLEIMVFQYMNDILRSLEMFHDVFTRESFERHYDLTWTEPPASPEESKSTGSRAS